MAVEKEINLSSIVEVMWERARGISLFTFSVLILAMLVSLTIHNRYTATAKVLMNKSKLGEQTMVNPAIPFRTYMDLAESEAMYQNLLFQYELTESPYNFKYPDDLQERADIIIVGDTSLLRIEVELEDADIAAQVANDIAHTLIGKASEIIQMETLFSADKITSEVNKLREDVLEKKEQYENLLLNNNKQLIANQLETYNSILAKERSEIPNILSAIQQMEGQTAKFKEVLSATDFGMIFKTSKSVLSDLLMTEIMRSTFNQDNAAALGSIKIEDEQINSGYIELRREFEKLTVDIEGQRNMLTDKKERVKELEARVKTLQETLNKMELDETFAKAEFDRALEIYSGIEKQEGWAATSVATERQDLYLIEPAVPPMKKSYPQRTLMVGIIGTLAFLLSFLYYLLRDLYGLVKSETGVEIKP